MTRSNVKTEADTCAADGGCVKTEVAAAGWVGSTAAPLAAVARTKCPRGPKSIAATAHFSFVFTVP